MAIYKVSFVVKGSDHPGGIINLDRQPIEGEKIKIGDLTLDVIEVIELTPPRGEFHYIHATCHISDHK